MLWSCAAVLVTGTLLFSLTTFVAAKLKTCVPQDLPAIDVFGVKVLDISAQERKNYDAWMPIPGVSGGPAKPLDFCNVTITYTHPGQNDTIHVYIFLPSDDWNGNYLGQGGGGWAAGTDWALPPGVAAGYATANTDAGHTYLGPPEEVALSARSWAYLSPGNIDWVLLQDFASRAISDLPKIAKEVIKGFYGKPAKYSYWLGCSTGGRQGLMSAQRFPQDYNGILAAAPAINWVTFLVTEFWPQLKMLEAGYYPPQCEFDAIRDAAIRSCDELDGVRDDMITAPGLCSFDAMTVVGENYDCEGDQRRISAKAAEIANEIWAGPKRNGKREWFGITHESALGGPTPFDGLARTVCDESNNNCKPAPFPIMEGWIQLFLAKDAEYKVVDINEETLWKLLHQSRTEFQSILSTDEPDLSQFKAAGGKMITWHGLADQLIFPNGSSNYYERVLAMDPNAADFYRYFEAPGVAHCFGGVGAMPTEALASLVDWVENGKAPQTLSAATIPADKSEAVKNRLLCPWPLVAAYKGGDPNDAASFECADHVHAFSNEWKGHDEL